jgi:hypothetical protein
MSPPRLGSTDAPRLAVSPTTRAPSLRLFNRYARTWRIALDCAVFAGLVIVGLARVPEPLFGDQAVYTLMGQVIADGGGPYRDLWDPQHPGIFFFFAAAGVLFGFHAIGVHLFELIWMLALAAAVRVVAGQYVTLRPAASLAPALTVGTYYAFTTSYHATQAEVLLGLPLLLALVSAMRGADPASRHRHGWLFVSGCSAGVVALFNLSYTVIPALFWFVAASTSRGVQEARARDDRRVERYWRPLLREMAPPLLAGLLLPVAVGLAYLAWKTGLALAWWTFVVYPFDASREVPRNPQRIADGVLWFGRTFRVPLVLAAIAVWAQGWRPRDAVTVGLLVWIGVGFVLVGTQVLAGWSYQYLLLLVPTGLLAVRGIERLWMFGTAGRQNRWPRGLAWAVLLALGVLLVRQLPPIASRVASVGSARPLPFTHERMIPYAAAWNRGYALDRATVAFLAEPGSHPGPIYVFAMPNLYLFSGRPPAIPFLAAWFRPTSDLWHRMVRELEEAAPPYILIQDHEMRFIIEQNPALTNEVRGLPARLEKRYRALREDEGGTWYVRRDLAPSH